MKYIVLTLVQCLFVLTSAQANITELALKQAAATMKVPYKLLSSLCWVESRHLPRSVNAKDGISASYGLCQIKLETAKWMGYTGTKEELLNPIVNANWAAKYLRKQYNKYGDWRRAISAYNAGHAITGNIGYVTRVFTHAMRH